MAAPWRMAVAVLSFNATPSSWRGSFVVAVCGGAIRMAPWRSWRRHGGNLLFWGLFFGLFVWAFFFLAIFWGLFWVLIALLPYFFLTRRAKRKKTARFLVFFLCLVQRRRLHPTPATSSNADDFVQRLRLRPIFHGRQNKVQEIQDNIKSRRNKIFLLMEELRRLRVQQRIKSMKNDSPNEENEMPDIPSSIPFLPHVTPRTLKQLYLTSFSFISGIIVFGGLIAPILELKLGLGGTSYEDFIRKMHLPMQLSEVDPIVASFSGGAVGVISALMLLEINNVEQQEKKRCKYCHGTGYLACARCSASGLCLSIEPIVTGASDRPLNAPTTKRCLNCSGAGKVMCPTCLCTGMIMASEHDPRIEPLGVKDRPYLGRPNRIDLLGSVRPSWS